jgi:hypothetical protein
MYVRMYVYTYVCIYVWARHGDFCSTIKMKNGIFLILFLIIVTFHGLINMLSHELLVLHNLPV